MTRDHFLRNLWRWKCGLPELDAPPTHRFTLAEAYGNWFPDFIGLMRNRMLQGIYRYGLFKDPNQPNYDRISSVLKRLALYRKDGNGEHLVDSANILGIEFTKRAHPNFHFSPVDDGIHTEVADK